MTEWIRTKNTCEEYAIGNRNLVLGHFQKLSFFMFSVSSFQVQDSITVYSLLVEKKKKIPSNLRQNLLELVAYYNESEAIEDGDETRQVQNEHDIL